MNKHQFHDSGIVDEGLSDETGSIEGDSNNQEIHTGKKYFLLFLALHVIYTTDKNDTLKKPNQSYLEIIAEAILKAPNRTMQLYEIYHYFQRK